MKMIQNEGSRDIRGAIEVTKGSIVAEVVDKCFAFVFICRRALGGSCPAVSLIQTCLCNLTHEQTSAFFSPQNLACTLVQALHRNFFCVKILNIVFNFDKLSSAELFCFVLFFCVCQKHQ